MCARGSTTNGRWLRIFVLLRNAGVFNQGGEFHDDRVFRIVEFHVCGWGVLLLKYSVVHE